MTLTLSNPNTQYIMKENGFIMKAFDLTGKVFGRLKVIKRSKENIRNRPAWICICECGNQTHSASHDLKIGDVKSCGCLKKDKLRVDLTNQIFGKLKVIKIGKSRGKSSSEFWLCKCDCGNEHTVSSQHLRLGQVRSCGCLNKKTDEILLNEAKERFFNNLEKLDSCWIWKGLFVKGYGVLFFKKNIKAHRFSYLIHKGELMKGLLICHTCDNPSCVNPEHLYQGTYQDNMDDKITRNRYIKTYKKTIICFN